MSLILIDERVLQRFATINTSYKGKLSYRRELSLLIKQLIPSWQPMHNVVLESGSRIERFSKTYSKMKSRTSKFFSFIIFHLLVTFLCIHGNGDVSDIPVSENSNSEVLESELLPELEPEEPAAEWPTAAHFSVNHADWPGNGQPLGHNAPSSTTDKVKAFPSRKIFIDDYLVPLVPLHITDPLKGTNFEKNWPRDSFYTTNAFAALKRVNVTGSDGKTREMSLREFFLQKSWDKTLELESSIPDYMRLDFPVPVSIQCKPIVEQLQEGKLRSITSKKTRVILHPQLDRLLCVARGKQNVSLVDTAQVQRDSNFSVELTGDLSGVNFQAVDFEKFPALRFAKFVKTEMRATDCLYVPAKWVSFQSTSGDYMEMELNWIHKRIDSSDKTCGNASSTTVTLGLIRMQQEPEIDLHGIMNIAPLQHFFNGVGHKNFTFDQMEQWLKRDKKILQKMTEWNEEYSAIAGELFLLLDLNRDALFSAGDLDFLVPDKQALFLGRLHDRMQDFNDLMMDQQADKAPASGAGGGGLSPEILAHLEKYNQEMKKLIADAVEQKKQQDKLPESEQPATNTKEPRTRSARPEPRNVNTDRDAEILDAETDGDAKQPSNKNDEPEEILAEDDDDFISPVKPSEKKPVSEKGDQDIQDQNIKKDEL